MPVEKTTQISIGEDRHKMLLEMQALYEERLELKVTLRAIVERAISKYHKEMTAPAKTDVVRDLHDEVRS